MDRSELISLGGMFGGAAVAHFVFAEAYSLITLAGIILGFGMSLYAVSKANASAGSVWLSDADLYERRAFGIAGIFAAGAFVYTLSLLPKLPEAMLQYQSALTYIAAFGVGVCLCLAFYSFRRAAQ